jgi:hypothetical protein
MLWFSYLYPHFRVNVSFKGPWHEIFYLCYFHQTIPPRPLIQGKSLLVSWSKFTKFVAQRCQWYHCVCMSPRCQWHCWAYHSSVTDTAVHPTLSNIFANDPKHYRYCSYGEIWLGCTLHSGINDTTVTCRAVSMTLLWLAQRYQCKYDTAVTLDLLFEWLWLPLKEISIEKTYLGKLPFTLSITFTQKIWGLTKDHFLS